MSSLELSVESTWVLGWAGLWLMQFSGRGKSQVELSWIKSDKLSSTLESFWVTSSPRPELSSSQYEFWVESWVQLTPIWVLSQAHLCLESWVEHIMIIVLSLARLNLSLLYSMSWSESRVELASVWVLKKAHLNLSLESSLNLSEWAYLYLYWVLSWACLSVFLSQAHLNLSLESSFESSSPLSESWVKHISISVLSQAGPYPESWLELTSI